MAEIQDSTVGVISIPSSSGKSAAWALLYSYPIPFSFWKFNMHHI
jgi:hypothetical protein